MRLLLPKPAVIVAALVLIAYGCGSGTSNGRPSVTATGQSTSTVQFLDATPGKETTPVPAGFEPLPGAKVYFGTIDRAAYRIEMPENWNGELLLWAHGFHGFGQEVMVGDLPFALREVVIAQGYAWAASSFSENGWVPAIGANDTLRLKQHFIEEFGVPERTFIAGASMGGNIVVLSLENFADHYDGGLSLCGVVAGVEWLDYLLGWSMAAEFVSGVEFPLDEGKEKVTEVVETEVWPALGPPEAPTGLGKAFASVIRNLTGGQRPFFDQGFRAAYDSNFGLVTGDPGRFLPMTRAATTLGLDFRADPGLGFDGDVINHGVRRLPPDAEFRDPTKHPGTAPTSGQIQAPLLTLHETGDLTVPVSMEQQYRRKVEAAGTSDLLVQRLIRNGGHCEFSESELVRAWNDLTAWVEGQGRPAGDDVFGDLSDAGRTFTDPLRPGDPGAVPRN